MKLPDISIVGSGVYLGKHFTLETIDVLKSCEKIFTIIREDTNEWLPEGVTAEINDLYHLYEINANRSDNYNRVVDYILDAATPDHPIAYLTYGNPVVFDSVAHGVLEKAPERGRTVKMYSTVSSVDTILVDLGKEMAPGLQIFEASFLVGYEIEPRIDLPCILLQLGVFGSFYATYEKAKSSKLKLLEDYLRKFYPDDHPLFLVNSQGGDNYPSYVLKVPVGELDNVDDARICQSLYIPKLVDAKPNEEFLNLMSQAPTKE